MDKNKEMLIDMVMRRCDDFADNAPQLNAILTVQNNGLDDPRIRQAINAIQEAAGHLRNAASDLSQVVNQPKVW